MAEHQNVLVDIISNLYAVDPGLDQGGMDQLTGANALAFGSQLYLNMVWTRVERNAASDLPGGQQICTFSPHWLIDPRLGHPPYVAKFRSLVAVEHQADIGVVFFGFGGWNPGAAQSELYGIGFRSTNGGNWYRVFEDNGGASRVDADTGIASDGVIHFLEVQLDGRTGVTRWLIDGVQIGTDYTLPGNLQQLGIGYASDPGWPAVGLQCWNNGASGGHARGYYLPAHREPVFVLQTGTPDGDVGPTKPVESLTLAGASFADVAGNAFVPSASLNGHYLSQWQITLATDTTFSSPVQDIVTNTALEAVRHTGLSASTNYIARVRYIDTGLGISSWSDAINVNTVATDPSTGWGACP